MIKDSEDKHPGENLLTANLVWDLVPHDEAPDILVQMGIAPPSPEGQKRECYVSHLREALVAPITKDLDLMSQKIAEIAIRVILGDAAKELGPELTKSLVKQHELIINAALKAALATILSSGTLVFKRTT